MHSADETRADYADTVCLAHEILVALSLEFEPAPRVSTALHGEAARFGASSVRLCCFLFAASDRANDLESVP
jgi:hypothetical protein